MENHELKHYELHFIAQIAKQRNDETLRRYHDYVNSLANQKAGENNDKRV